MAITLTEETRAARTAKIGNDVFEMTAGETLEIKDEEEELLSATVPAGKTWTVQIGVYIEEV